MHYVFRLSNCKTFLQSLTFQRILKVLKSTHISFACLLPNLLQDPLALGGQAQLFLTMKSVNVLPWISCSNEDLYMENPFIPSCLSLMSMCSTYYVTYLNSCMHMNMQMIVSVLVINIINKHDVIAIQLLFQVLRVLTHILNNNSAL